MIANPQRLETGMAAKAIKAMGMPVTMGAAMTAAGPVKRRGEVSGNSRKSASAAG